MPMARRPERPWPALALTLALGGGLLGPPVATAREPGTGREPFLGRSKPYTRWWWFAGKIDKHHIDTQLAWLARHNFGGVELAFIYPHSRDPRSPRFAFLGPEWREAVVHAKRRAGELDLGCDFTFGTLWPFGGSFVGEEDRTRVYGKPDFKQGWRLSWEHGRPGNVLNHLDREALERYAARVGGALEPALEGGVSALFCDSWEVETRRIWTPGLGGQFERTYGYDVRPFMENIYADANAGPRYDYMKLVSRRVLDHFYRPFARICRRLGGLSRVQCAGSPTDILAAYAAVDIPESEALLFEPDYSRIPASAAALASRPVVSAESFTCIYGFPGRHLGREVTADLKLLADALFARGVNQIVWHGMPFNPPGGKNRFYATVHLGPDGDLAADLAGFNAYLEKVSALLKRGVTYSDVACYLPLEDGWIAGEYPPERQLKWSWGAYELRHVRPPAETRGHHPLWVSAEFLRRGKLEDGRLRCGDTAFSSLYVDVEYMDSAALSRVLELARKGFPVILKRAPREPGRVKSGDYAARLAALQALPGVGTDLGKHPPRPPLAAGEDVPPYWCRREGDVHYLFFAHPAAGELRLPMERGMAWKVAACERKVRITLPGFRGEVVLRFAPRQSVMLRIDGKGKVRRIDIGYDPPRRKEEDAAGTGADHE